MPKGINKIVRSQDPNQKLAFNLLKREGHRFGEGEFDPHIDYVWELNNAQIQPENSTECLKL